MTTDEIQKVRNNLPRGYRKALKEACKCSIAMVDKSLSPNSSKTTTAMLVQETAALMAEEYKNRVTGLSEKIEQL
jgi:hypothetical protein